MAPVNQQSLLREQRKPRAIFSPCERYRYFLAWPTGRDNDRALGIFANPSTATAEKPDPTVTRWIDYCRRWGFGWAFVCNARAWRHTNPKMVPPDPVGVGPRQRLPDRALGGAGRDRGLRMGQPGRRAGRQRPGADRVRRGQGAACAEEKQGWFANASALSEGRPSAGVDVRCVVISRNKMTPLRTPRRRLTGYEIRQQDAAEIVQDWLTRQRLVNAISPDADWTIQKLIEDLRS